MKYQKTVFEPRNPYAEHDLNANKLLSIKRICVACSFVVIATIFALAITGPAAPI